MNRLIRVQRRKEQRIIFLLTIVFLLAFLIFLKESRQEVIIFEEPINYVVETEEVYQEFIPRYGFTEEDIYLLAQVLCGGKDIDGDGEYDIDFQKKINYHEVDKVLSVIMNRVRSDIYPDTVCAVVMQKGQFSVIPRVLKREPSDKALEVVRSWCEKYNLYSDYIQLIPDNHLYFCGNGVTNTTRAKWK